MDIADQLLALMNTPRYRPADLRRIGKLMHLSRGQAPLLEAAVEELQRRGVIEYVRGARIALSGTSEQQLGILARREPRFGFITPTTGDARQDVYVGGEDLGTALEGDLVRFRRTTSPQGPRGQILEILRRAREHYPGIFRRQGRDELVITDGRTTHLPIRIRAGAAAGAEPGLRVLACIERFVGQEAAPQGRVIQVLGPPGDPACDHQAIVEEFQLPGPFAADVQEAAAVLEQPRQGAPAPPGREDFRDQLVLTIDPADAKDYDDALGLVLHPDGRRSLYVHIADVGQYVAFDDPIDLEARRRGTSVYLPGWTIPMLPERLSNDICSLREGLDRYVYTACIELDAQARPTGARFVPGLIRSRARLSYPEVLPAISDSSEGGTALEPDVRTLLRNLARIARQRRKLRLERGALILDLAELHVELDGEGRCTGLSETKQDEAHALVEECMLLANEAAAERGRRLGLPLVRRVHRPPPPDRLEELADFLGGLGQRPARPVTRQSLQTALDRLAVTPQGPAAHMATLRAMEKACYDLTPDEHFALASPDYCHFTSPIRRYPDLLVHRVLRGAQPTAPDARLAGFLSGRELKALEAERAAKQLKIVAYLQPHIGEEFAGRIVALGKFGLIVRCRPQPFEGLVPLDSSGVQDLRYDPARHIVGRPGKVLRLGDDLRVRLVAADPLKRTIELEYLSQLKG